MSGETRAADNAASKPRLVCFFPRTSGRARRVEAWLASALQRGQNHDTFLLQRVTVEEHPQLAERFRVNGVPTLFVIEGRQVVARIEDPRGPRESEETLEAMAPSERPYRRDGLTQTRAPESLCVRPPACGSSWV